MIDALLISGLGILALAAFAGIVNFLLDRSVKAPPRAYTGEGNYSQPTDNWFDPVASYFGRRLDGDERVARAIDSACFPETENEAASRKRPAPRAMEVSSSAIRK